MCGSAGDRVAAQLPESRRRRSRWTSHVSRSAASLSERLRRVLFGGQVTDTKRKSQLYWVTFFLCFCSALVPIWWPRLLPLCDMPTHLMMIGIWHRLPEVSWHYQDFYVANPIPVPYWGYYLPVHLLSYLFDVEVANKIYLSIYAGALPLSVRVLARRLGASPWTAIATFPFVFNYSFGWGFLSFCAGIPVALCAIAALLRVFEERVIRWRYVVLVHGLTLATYFMHILPWILVGGFGIILVLSQVRRRFHIALATAGALALTLLLAVLNYYYVAQLDWSSGQPAFAIAGRWGGWDGLPLLFTRRLLIYWENGWADELTLLALAGGWLGWLISTGRDWRRGLRWEAVALVALALIAYLALPSRLYRPIDWFNVSPRYAVFFAIFIWLLLQKMPPRWVLVPIILASLLYPLVLARRFRDYDRRAASYLEVVAKIPRGSSVLTLLCGADNSDPAVGKEFVPYALYFNYTQFLVGGFNPYANRTGFPYRYLPGRALPAPPWNFPEYFSQEVQGRFYDYVLTRSEPKDHWIFVFTRPDIQLVAQAGQWRLYATKGR